MNTKKIGVLISLLLISLIALSAVSAAEDAAVDDADVAAVEEVVEVNDAPATNEINYESNDIVVTDTGDSGDLDDADTDVISDTGLKGDSDNGDEAVVSDASSPKNVLKAEIEPEEPLGAPDGTFTDLTNLINRATAGSTITLDRNYVYSTGDSTDGVYINKAITIDGAGFTIDGKNAARPLRIATNGAVTLKNLNFANGVAPNTGSLINPQYRGGAIYCTGGTTLTITNCTFDDNRAGNVNNGNSAGGAIYIGSGRMTVTHSEFYNNRAYNGGAIYQPQNPTFVSIKGCAIVNNTATGYGNFSYLATGADQRFDYTENWWGDNYGPAFNVYSERVDAYLPRYDYYIATEILTSPITIEVNMVLDSGNEPTVPLEPRHAIISQDADTCNTTDGWVPEPFIIEFTTGSDAYINVTIDNQHLVLKVFAGENKKNITELRVVVDNVTLPAQPIAYVYSDIDGPYNLTLGTRVIPVTVEDGVGTYQFTDLDVGQYSIIVSRVDDPVYKTTFNTTEFEVKKYLNTLTISTETPSITFGEDVTITHEFDPTGPTGNIIYYVDGSTTGTELNVDQDFTLSGLSAGTHTVEARYGGDNKYGESVSNTLTINVAQANLEINISDVTVNYPNKGNIKVNASVDGKYTIKVNNKEYEVIIVDGEGNFDVTEDLVAGTYAITWDIEESENYTAASGEAVYKVLHAAPDFSISGDDKIDYNTANTITPTINSDATGTISYSVNGSDPVSKGVNEAFVTDILDVGKYTVVATYSGDDNYEEATAEFEFEVLPIDVIITVENEEVAYPNTGALILTASVPGTYTVKVGDKPYTAVVTEAGVPVEVEVTDVLDVDVYDVSVTAPASQNYKEVDTGNIATYTVTKAQSTIAVTYEDGTFTVTLDGVNDEKLSETYHVTIDNENQDDEETVDGVDTFTKEGLGPGKHNVFVIFDGNDNYAGNYAQTSFDIPKATTAVVTITPTKDSYAYGEDVYLDVTVKDGETGLTGSVTVSIGGIDYAITVTGGVGQAIVKGLENGTFEANAKFLGNDEYEPADATPADVVVNASTKITVTASSEPVTYGENSFIDVSVVDGAGNAVEITSVNVTLKGETDEYPVTDGKVDLGVLDADTYTVIVSYVDEAHEEASAPANVVVNPAVSDITVTAGEGSISIEAKDNEGNYISGTATVVVDGVEAGEVAIDETGKVDYTIDAAPGAHTVDVTFNKENYLSDHETVVVTVPKAESSLSIAADKEDYTFGDAVTITPTLTEGATGTITYFVDGATTGTEVAIGEDFVLSGLAAGPHSVVAKYSGDSNYDEATSNTLEFTIAKAALEITVEDVTVQYPNKETITVKANVDGKYTIKVETKDYEVNVVDGEGSFAVDEVLAAGTHTISWDIAETDNYGPATGSANYIVENTKPEFSISGTDEIDYGQTNTITPTINSDATGTISYSINGSEPVSKGVNEAFETDILDAGKYTVVATYSGDENYASASAEFEFDVLPIDAVVTVENVEVVYPNTANVTVTASVPGTYTVTINGKEYEAVVGEDGKGTAQVTDVFDAGKYDIGVTADLGDNYKPVSISSAAVYSVTKAQSTMTVSYEDGTFTVTLDGVNDEKLSETYHVIIDNVNQADEATVDGVDTFTKDELGPGKHSVFVIFDGNDNYVGSYAQTSFDLPKKTGAVVTVSADPIKEGEEAVIIINVKDGETGLSGVVTVTLDGTDYAVDVTDGEGTLKVKNLVSTDSPEKTSTVYPITAKFNGNDEYEEATGEGSIEVTDYNDVIIVISGGDNSAVATLIDSDLNPINGMVNVTVDDKEPVELEVVDGKVTIPVDEEGDHDITVSFPGDETHKENSESATVFVGKRLIPTNMLLTVSDITYTENEEVVVTLKDENGYSLSGKVTLTIGDLVKEVTVTDGQAKTTISGLDAGTKTVIGEYVTDGTYAGTVVSTTFTVKQMKTRIIANNMTTTAINVSDDGRIGQYLTMTLVDAKGRVLANKKVSFGFNAKVYNRTTDAKGQAKLQINLQKAGDYTFAITFLGDKNYEGAFEVVKITVKKQKATMTASGATYKASAKTKTLTASLKDVAGNPMPEKKVTFTVNGKTYSAMTDSKGVAKVKVSLNKKGSYAVQVKFVGTSTYEALTRKVTLKLT